MAVRINLDLVTPDRKVVSGEFDMVKASGVEGEFGVLPGHCPLLALLKPGVVTAVRGQETQRIAIKSGMAEVEPDRMIILTQSAATADEIDEAETRRALKQAETRLAECKDGIDAFEFKLRKEELDWQTARLAAVTDHTK